MTGTLDLRYWSPVLGLETADWDHGGEVIGLGTRGETRIASG